MGNEEVIGRLMAMALNIDIRPKNVATVIDGTGELAHRYGGTVYDKCGKTWDWGQAVCRELYGVDWSNSEGFQDHEDRHADDDDVDAEGAEIVTRWLQGDLPEWMNLSPMKTPVKV